MSAADLDMADRHGKAPTRATKVGDRVRVPAREGVVTLVQYEYIVVEHNSGTRVGYSRDLASDIEVLPPPEPEYVADSYYLANDERGASRTVWVRTIGGCWRRPGETTVYDHEVPTRPLVRLVPEGQS
jgi:hypothetical protein